MSNLLWKKVGDTYSLLSPTEELVKLKFELGGKTLFWMDNKAYEVKRSGFWNQRYTVYLNNVEVVSVTHQFWGSKGIIRFPEGDYYTIDYNYKNTLTLQFLDHGNEIVSYCVGEEKGQRRAIMNIGIALIDAERLLIIATLGKVMFLNIFNEFNMDDGDFLVMVATSS